jgi:hypothetical protein
MSLKRRANTFVLCTICVGVSLCLSQSRGSLALAHRPQTRQLQRQTESLTTWPNKAKRWALIVGVDQYRDGQINALKGSVNDAHALANALVRYAGFPQDQVIVLTTDQPEERQPTRINILTYLSNLASLVPKDGLLLFSFAGHGIERGGQAFLIPSDARLSHDISLLEESAVSVTRMHDRIKAIGVGQVIVLLDACRNDPGGRADAPNNMTAAYTKFNFDVRNREVQAFATFYATAVGYRAYEYTEKHQGYFTWAIVEGLKGAAANEKGEVTLAALVKYVQDNVPKRIAIDLGATEQQKPFATIDGYRADELVVALSGPKAKNAASNPLMPTPDPATIEMSFWDSIKNSNNAADFQAYLNKYPNGQFVELAKLRLQPSNAKPSNPMPTVPNIIENYISALGGKTAYEKLDTIVLEGIAEMSVGGKTFLGTARQFVRLPSKSVFSLQFPDIMGEALFEAEGFDGATGWMKTDKNVRASDDWEQAFKKRSDTLSYLTDAKQFYKIYAKDTLKGIEKIGNREAYVIEAEPDGAKPEILYFDTQTGLLIRVDVMHAGGKNGVAVPIQNYLDEYADINGFKVPIVIRQESRGSTMTIKFGDVKYNVPVDDHIFSRPPK